MILDKIVASTKLRVEKQKKELPLYELKNSVNTCENPFSFEKALASKNISFICEVKKASPSKGIISEKFPYKEIAKEYENCGAAAISVLTEPQFFMGDNNYLEEISNIVNIPILRKDFIIDEYQIYEARKIGASAILLICSIIDESTIKKYIKIADSLGMSSLIEAHDEREIYIAKNANARIIGVNNRNLKDFSVDITNSIKLRKLVEKEILFVSESGIRSYEDIKLLEENGTNAVLIGEILMKSEDIKKAFDSLRGTA